MPPWVIAIIVSTLLNIAAYIISPKPKAGTAEDRPQWELPTCEQRPMPVIFGDVLLRSPNCLWFGDKFIRVYKIKVD